MRNRLLGFPYTDKREENMNVSSQNAVLPQRENNDLEGDKRGRKMGLCSSSTGQGH